MGDLRHRFWDAGLDLAAGSSCALCGRAGRALCRPCRGLLPQRGRETRPTPCPPGLVPLTTTAEYAGGVRALVLRHKEHGAHGLAAPLGDLLAVAVVDALRRVHGQAWPDPPTRPRRVVLVPVPSHPAVVRDRGHDPLLRMARRAAGSLRARGVHARVARPLRVVGRPADQAGLDASSRAVNLAGRFEALPGAGATVPGRDDLVLVDDVVTTGWTLRAAQAALEQAGRRPVGAATLAATRRRVTPVTSVPVFGGRLSEGAREG